jgi:hypothetical protein
MNQIMNKLTTQTWLHQIVKILFILVSLEQSDLCCCFFCTILRHCYQGEMKCGYKKKIMVGREMKKLNTEITSIINNRNGLSLNK